MSGYEAIEEAIRRLRSSENIYDHVSQTKVMVEIKRLHSDLAAAQARVAALEGVIATMDDLALKVDEVLSDYDMHRGCSQRESMEEMRKARSSARAKETPNG